MNGNKCIGKLPMAKGKGVACKNSTVYMRTNKAGKKEFWCAEHWVRYVEGPNSESYKDHHPKVVKKRRRLAKKVAKKAAKK